MIFRSYIYKIQSCILEIPTRSQPTIITTRKDAIKQQKYINILHFAFVFLWSHSVPLHISIFLNIVFFVTLILYCSTLSYEYTNYLYLLNSRWSSITSISYVFFITDILYPCIHLNFQTYASFKDTSLL